METDIEKPELQTSVPKLISVAPAEQREATSRNRRLVLAGIVASVAVPAAITWWLSARNTKQEPTFGNAIATVRRADFLKTLRVNGTVEAVSYQPIAAPRLSGPGSGSLIITRLATSGRQVKAGELLVEFDRQTQIKNALDRQADYVDFVQQINKKRADQAAVEAVDLTALKQAENAMESARLELKRNEIVSRIDQEKNQENFDEAKATFDQLKATFELKRKAAQADVRSLEIQRDRAKSAMEYAQKNTERLAIKSPIDGIVVLNTIWKGGQMGEVQEGDEVRPGVPFMQVVNSGAMLVRARVNQADVQVLSAGQTVNVGLDAYPELQFAGKIERIAAIGVTSGLNSKVRTFQVLFTINGTDAKLMPDLSASVDVQLAKQSSVLVVPRDSLIVEDGQTYVMAGNVGAYSKTKVKVGEINDTDAVIASGLKEGTRVLRNGAL
jgi:HlyD family secretion protein